MTNNNTFDHLLHGDYVLLRKDEQEQINQTKSGIFAVEFIDHKVAVGGVVVAVGSGEVGSCPKLTVLPGDTVICRPNSGFPVTVDDESLLVVSIHDVVLTLVST